MQNTLDTWVGQQLDNGRYEIESLLGKGGMGSVFLAVDKRLDTRSVVKVPNPALLADEGFATRFSREIRSLVELEHPHIVKISDVGEHDGIPYLVMGYLAGGSLEDRRVPLDQDSCEPMEPSQLRNWLPHVADALDFIHSRGYLHRDIKQGNILFDAHGHSFLGDFGIAKAMHSGEIAQETLTQAGVVGTMGFIAPEILVGKDYDGRVDQYSLAVVIHETLSGRRLFDGSNLFAVANQQTRKAATPLVDLIPTTPQHLSDTLKRALSRDPRRRFASCSEFSSSVLSGLPPSADGEEIPAPRRTMTQHAAQTAVNQRLPQRQATTIEKPSQRRPAAAGATMIEEPVVVEVIGAPDRPTRPRQPSGVREKIQSLVHTTLHTDTGRRRLYWGLGIGGGLMLLVGGSLMLAFLFSLILSPRARVAGELESGDETYTFGEFMDRYEFEADSGQMVTVRMMSDDFDTWIFLDGPGGIFEWNDDYIHDTNTYTYVSVLDVELSASGVYEVLATSYNAGQSGAYVLEVELDGRPVSLSQVDPLEDPYVNGNVE